MDDFPLSRFEATEGKVSKKRYVVELSPDERKRLEQLIRIKARILLQADESPLGAKWTQC